LLPLRQRATSSVPPDVLFMAIFPFVPKLY
jgi:hypothetical protein